MKRSYLFLVLVLPLLGFTCGKEVFTGKREARGIWMSRNEYAGGTHNPDSIKARIHNTFEKARKAKLNMVIFHIRGNGTAFYNSSIEPWASELTGTLGKDPGWDPLQYAIDEAHRLGLELHAWVNTFPIWRSNTPPPESTPRQPFLAHPEWVICDKNGKPMRLDPPNNNYIWVSPGIPAVRQHVLSVVMDIVKKYDIDGIHFDYIRYPEGSPTMGYSHDSISVARFSSPEGNPQKLSWEHWQREQVDEFVADAYNAITEAKPWVKVSASVIGKYMGDGWSGYYVVYQDPRRWMEVGKMDFIVPMVYWERAHKTHPFIPLIAQWQDRVAYDRQVMPGLSTGLIKKIGWEEIVAEVQEVRKKGLPGVVFFSAGGLEQSWQTLGMDEFPYWSLVPTMSWKDSIPPSPPTNLSAQKTAAGVLLHWSPPSTTEPLTYVIYRSQKEPVMKDDVMSIASVTGWNVTSFTDAVATDGTWFYAVSALDRMQNESKLSSTVNSSLAPVAARGEGGTH